MAGIQAISGDKELMKKFDTLPTSLQKKGLRKVLRANAKIVLNSARQNLRAQQEGGTGALSKGLKVRAVRRSRTKFGAGVNLRADHSGDEFYGLFLEFGLTKTTPPRRHRKSGKSTGDLPEQPFLRPALYDNKSVIRRNTRRALRDWLRTLVVR